MMKRVAFAGFAVLSLAIAAKDVHAQSAVPADQQSFGSSLLSGVRQAGQDAVNQSVTNTRSNLENRANSYNQNISNREKALSDKVNGYRDSVSNREKALSDRVDNAQNSVNNKVNGYRDGITEREKALTDRATNARNNVNNNIKSYRDDVNNRREDIDNSYKAKKSQLKATRDAGKSLLGNW
ncbi:hypothetical protein [Acetobacter sicerae]|uniref:hypothetical protein n=1 Tax=Acetobacter sicerae TaxID=85325 RepID=UPI00156ABDF3|nr:hypothetical protein [Acetobacter sicerae]NHN91956.1 hypothetical protein [Acetobacter sicerae]